MMTSVSPATREALGKIEYDSARSALLFADSAAGLARCRRVAAAAGCRVSAAAAIADAPARLGRQVATDAVFLDLEGDPGEPLDLLLDSFREAAEVQRYNSVVAAPRDLRGRIAAGRLPPGMHCLFAPSGLDRLIAFEAALVRRAPRFQDVKGQGVARLQQLSEEVGRIATMLAALSENDIVAAEDEEGAPRIDAGMVRAIIRARRLRDQFFKSELFADPAWDMLLDLFAARLEERRVAVSSLCIAAAVPPTTALRWIKSLSDQGIFVRVADPEDGRRVFIQLSNSAAAGLEAYLRAAQRISPLVI